MHRGVLVHVGAHRGQELPRYIAAGFSEIHAVEPVAELAELCQVPGVTVHQVAAGREQGTFFLNVTKDSQFNSLYVPLSKSVVGRQQVDVYPVRDLVPHADVLVVDVQGAELDVVEGADLDRLSVVVLETRAMRDYAMCPLHDNVIEYMVVRGWKVHTMWPHRANRLVHDVMFVPRKRSARLT